MARQHGITKFTGKLGDVVGVRSKSGAFFVRSHYQIPPELWKNDPNYEPNRKTAHNFGSDSKFATYIRHSLSEYLPLMADQRLHNRLQSLVGQARAQCMRADPKAPLDIRKIAPAFRRFSLRKDLTINDITQFTPKWQPQPDGSRNLYLPKLLTTKSKWRRVNVEIVSWHIALIALPDGKADLTQFPNQFFQSEWMSVDAIKPVEIPINIPANSPPILIAIGLTPAQGSAEDSFTLRSLSVMEILEII